MSVNINDQNDQIYTSSSILKQNDTGGFIVASGDNVANKPTPSGNNGLIRYNTLNNVLETVINGVYYNIAIVPSGPTALVSGYVQKTGDNMTGALGIISGSTSAPGLYINGSSSTGVFSSAANSISIGTNALEVVKFDNVQNTTFNYNVAIGTIPPIRNLHISSVGEADVLLEYTNGKLNQRIWRLMSTGLSGNSANFTIDILNDNGTASVLTGLTINGTNGVVNFPSSPTAPTPSFSDNSNNVATTGFVQSAMPTGVTIPFAGSTAPAGWMLCYGQAISRTIYSYLFSVIGTTYGSGDGSTTFNLPDLRGRSISGQDNMGGSPANRVTTGGSGISGITLGASGGEETHVLSVNELAAHGHLVNDLGHKHNNQVQSVRAGNTGNYWACYVDGPNASSGGAGTNPGIVDNLGSYSANTGITINNTGSNSPHNNMQPTMIMNYIIKT